MKAFGGATGFRYSPAAEIPAFTISDVSKNKPAPSTTANDRNRSFTTLNMLRTVLEVLSSATPQMVFRASFNSLTAAVAPINRGTSPRRIVAMLLLGRCAPSIMA